MTTAEPSTKPSQHLVRWQDQTLDLANPVALRPVNIAKPWGQEIWYTGMEARGESGVVVQGHSLLLSEYLALAPVQLCGSQTPVLLKILDPDADSHLGDLYFEVHETKQEVYVVTHVDTRAWPTGAGSIRYGMNQELRRQYNDDAKFRADYLTAVTDYEKVRRQLDNQPTTQALAELEISLRDTMDAFTQRYPLHVGDVVTVDPWFPHSLQHGVRVVELQTPTYERLIISFAQQVLTQDHWDSTTAIANMSLDAPPAPHQVGSTGEPQLIANYSDFKAFSLSLEPGASFAVPAQAAYGLCINVSGTLTVGELSLKPEDAALLPRACLPCTLSNPETSRQPCQLILGGPPHFQLA